MARDFKFERRTITTGLALLLAADVAMGVYSWRLSKALKTTPQSMDIEAFNLKKLKADIESAEKVKADLPKTVKDCDKFEQGFPLAANASSSIEGELYDVSTKSGIQLTRVHFHDKQMTGTNLTERLI